MSVAVSLWITVALVALSAFFVAIEFALVAARRYRLEEAAETSAAARAALKSAKDLSLLLAGSQLGITLCVLGLGAVSKPAVESLLAPLFGGLGESLAGVLSFVLSLVVVTFLHLVVGEMAPKSWAIAHPERSATLLALPMRGFMVLTRPLLVALNGMANWCLRRVGVEPVDELGEGRNPDDLRELVDHSASTGALDSDQRDQILSALDLDRAPLRDIVRPRAEVAGVPATATVEQIREASRKSGHLRLVVGDAQERPVGVVHVRDALAGPAGTTAADLMRPVATLSADTAIHDALRAMREERNHLALVESDGELLGLVTLQDLLDRLLPAPA
ncbi:HlyC/CorC family transporter [Pseudonocardia sp. KRD-184]|uniref:HlyC/CorC family transporter n=1 Tax=Pseudonocardia oceani TaxID=2792013 RepID=A0ABS6U4U4_9PSEU|nr:hemolysin family protein [Pseudonocardia oceani]MBW0090097.1 HlyC/CorC family transporter [Pseudonocardia oceani]MBW0097189.1 HlyC/CorC family transporter [Pseudonocardia oceani]MBW0121337.1 HlyC/CorC family transporter [Pseudonocardia oceani]MBW0127247.1 HlyC/CorC family transporter [Pseudonocardia oceani]